MLIDSRPISSSEQAPGWMRTLPLELAWGERAEASTKSHLPAGTPTPVPAAAGPQPQRAVAGAGVGVFELLDILDVAENRPLCWPLAVLDSPYSLVLW